ncbi:hypothetical protein EMPS_00706 [Entomortierella parvispora]|uniref:Uncharacterized protein n=1 Tax=Entomortierella parvispora TaxID=205924 RepID=A0A9P3H1J9_9FUNG|nr:hypothetical protein EMPS_00706 [Entomortierella parvispora]
MLTLLPVYERVRAELIDADRRELEERTAISASADATKAAGAMVSGSVKAIAESHLRSLKRPTGASHESDPNSDDDFQQPSSASPKKNRQESSPAVDPWLGLQQAARQLQSGQRGIRIPMMPGNLSDNHRRLYNIAHRCLNDANGPLKTDRDAINIKDALVAMSCILNLRSARSDVFPPAFVASATDQCYEISFHRHELVETCFDGLVEILNEKGVLGLRDAVEEKKIIYMKERQGLHTGTRSQEEKLMDIITIACDLVSEKLFEEPHGEADTLHLWLKIFEKLLPVGTGLTMKTGESMLTCTRPDDKEEEDMNGRKVDLKFLYSGIEVAVVEFKSASQPRGMVAKQFRKSIRLGKNIHQSLAALGVEDGHVICGDISGFMGSFTKIRTFEDIYVAGKVTDTIVSLPTSRKMLSRFLDGTAVAVLMNFVDYLEVLGSNALDIKETASVLANEERFELQIEHRKPAAFVQQKTFRDTIIHSPRHHRS